MGIFSVGNKTKSQGPRSGKYGGCGTIKVLFLAKYLRTSNGGYHGAKANFCSSTNPNVSGEFFAQNLQIIFFLYSSSDSTIAKTIFFKSLIFLSVVDVHGRAARSTRSYLLDALRTFCTTVKHCFCLR